MKAIGPTVLALAILLFGAYPALAHDDAVSVIVGFGKGSLLPPQPDYEFAHIGVAFEHKADAWLDAHLGWDPPGEWMSYYMPYLGIITEPEDNVELSVAVGFRGIFPIDKTWRPFIYGGGGPIYTTQHTLEQSTQLNFGSFAGYGLEYMLDEHHSLCYHYAIRHFSNASVEDPNDGVDVNAWALAYTTYF